MQNQFPQLNTLIDYFKIYDALQFYPKLGYKLVEVPWVVSSEAERITGNGFAECKSYLGTHVASAEQSFLELILRNELPEGKYITCTPCFRNDQIDPTHHKWFMKVELINFNGYKKLNTQEINDKTSKILTDALTFYSRYTNTTTEKTDIGFDIVSKGIELGSYGYREHDNFSWIYGTAVAEPRLSYVLSLSAKGYHNADIPKGIVGTETKIIEEFYEFLDANQSKNSLMELCELSDLIGAINMYLENRFKGGMQLEDLLALSNATQQAFHSGRRKS